MPSLRTCSLVKGALPSAFSMSIVFGSSRRSILVPTRRMGVFGLLCWSSGALKRFSSVRDTRQRERRNMMLYKFVISWGRMIITQTSITRVCTLMRTCTHVHTYTDIQSRIQKEFYAVLSTTQCGRKKKKAHEQSTICLAHWKRNDDPCRRRWSTKRKCPLGALR